ncbi:PQ-loop repeat-containing protein 3-like [Elysia marginata]|uniref:PQ-loop repeat-containing protein 3-like n=1 Tax=Elysia marginata TaxID=1093978 RepID=A0AAV4JNS6_9GAST|nr:PQ-loop repeat-containing protein 3-like [Elysia marginata]
MEGGESLVFPKRSNFQNASSTISSSSGGDTTMVETIHAFESETSYSWLLSLCTFLSYTVVVNTFFYKAPQVYAIIHSGSSLGVSLTSVTLEWIAYSIMLTYHYAMEYPLETYLEIILMVLQDCLLTVVILTNRDMISINVIPYTFIYVLGFIAIALKWLPDTLLFLAVGVTTPILCWSKVDQLVEILWTEDPGCLSALSWFIAVYDTGVRILTTTVITKDMPMFINLTASEILNIAVFGSILYFNNKKSQRALKPVELTQ